MPYYSSDILQVLYSHDKEIAEALGDDNYVTVKGNRRLTRSYSIKESAEITFEIKRKGNIHAATTAEGIVPGGVEGGGRKKSERSVLSNLSVLSTPRLVVPLTIFHEHR